MPPKNSAKKRAVDSDWKTSDRVRAALVEATQAMDRALLVLRDRPDASVALAGDFRSQIVASSAALAQSVTRVGTDYNLPALPNDCWRIIMELALGQRTCATFGAGGRVNEARDYYGNITQSGFASIRPLRLVSRAWNRMASQLVRSLFLENGHSKTIRHPLSMADTFPNVARIRFRAPEIHAEYGRHVEQLRQRLHARWIERHPGSGSREIITALHPCEFLDVGMRQRFFHTFNDQLVCHAFAYRLIQNDTTLHHADAWCITGAPTLDKLLENTDLPPKTHIPVVFRHLFRHETMCISEWENKYKDITSMIDLHIVTYDPPVDLVIDYLIKCFASVTIHISEAMSLPWTKYQPNVRADAHHYEKIWTIGAAVPVIG